MLGVDFAVAKGIFEILNKDFCVLYKLCFRRKTGEKKIKRLRPPLSIVASILVMHNTLRWAKPSLF